MSLSTILQTQKRRQKEAKECQQKAFAFVQFSQTLFPVETPCVVSETGVRPLLQMRKAGVRDTGRASRGTQLVCGGTRGHAQVLESVCCPSCSATAVCQSHR